MKNIHLLPTDKPSRLFKFANELHLDTIPKDYYKKYNIYITSDEEIKDGEYGLSRLGEIIKFHSGYDYRYYAKIILTTDQDLIADGVQAIDDEFLEWFVKNPSCEGVEFNAYPIDPNGNIIGTDRPYPFDGLISNFRIDYKIIIPQEEPKQETLEEAALLNEETAWKLAITFFKESEGYEPDILGGNEKHERAVGMLQVGMLEGANWQAERMYSEEEVIKLLIYCKNRFSGSGLEDYHYDDEVKEWFKQFKKK
jgi:hypothetical protein